MKTLSLDEGVKLLLKDHCLWIGAGVSYAMTLDSDCRPPFWSSLTGDLEAIAGIDAPNGDFSRRLQSVRDRVGPDEFQAQLRDQILKPMQFCFMDYTLRRDDFDNGVPPSIRRVAKLGRCAESIVNFNIEPMSSAIVGGAWGPLAQKSYFKDPAFRGAQDNWSQLGTIRLKLTPKPPRYRAAIHPHGTLTSGGDCVICADEYRGQSASLAFQVATHRAMDSNLLIVGMSLDDEYLCDQISRFRSHIREVVWFGTDCSDQHSEWARRADVTRCNVSSWGDFWRAIDREIAPPRESALIAAYAEMLMWSLLDHAGVFDMADIRGHGGRLRRALARGRRLSDPFVQPPTTFTIPTGKMIAQAERLELREVAEEILAEARRLGEAELRKLIAKLRRLTQRQGRER